MNHTCLYSPCSRRVSPHFGRYSFSIQMRVEGWVGLSGWLQTKVVYPPTDGHPSQYSLIQTDVLPLSQAATWIVNMNKWRNDITGRPLCSTAKFSDISPTVRVTPTHIVVTHCQVQHHISLPVRYKRLLIFYKNVHYDSISSNILKTGNMRRPAIVY